MSENNEDSSCSFSCLPLIIGITIAMCMSWLFNHSVLWMILHGLLNWFYVAYKIVWYVVTNY